MLTRASVDCAERIVAIEELERRAVMELGVSVGMLRRRAGRGCATVSARGRGIGHRRPQCTGPPGTARADIAQLFLQRRDEIRQHLEGHDDLGADRCADDHLAGLATC